MVTCRAIRNRLSIDFKFLYMVKACQAGLTPNHKNQGRMDSYDGTLDSYWEIDLDSSGLEFDSLVMR
jgi:hypothetical protein